MILKIDIEGYECKALPEEIIIGSSGKRIPFIFLEWGQLVSWTSIQLLTKKDIILILCLRPSLKSNSLRHRQVGGLRHVLSIFGGKQHLAEPDTPHTIQVFDSLSSGGSVSIIQ